MKRILALSALLWLAACGSDDAPPLGAADTVDFSQVLAAWEIEQGGVGGDSAGDGGAAGAAGDGSPLKAATVVLVDANGKTVTGRTDSKGHYLLRFKTAEFKAPFLVKVLDAEGNVLASATDTTVASGKVTRVNINPLTDKATSDALVNVKGTDREFNGSAVDVARLAKGKADVTTSVKAALGVAGVTNTDAFDPVRSIYKYDGTGVDAVIESVSHARNPETGATELRAKLAPLTTSADGVVTPTLITPSTPLATSQVAISANPALTFSKVTAWIDRINSCLALASGVETPECNDNAFQKMVAPNYKHSGKDWDEDFRALCSEADRACITGSTFRNPNILFLTRTDGSAIDNIAVVEVTINQPRTGPLSGNLTTPIEYVKYLVFRRDDSTPGLVAGNWILVGNQRNYDWSVEPQYYNFTQLNPKYSSTVVSGVRFFINTRKFDLATRTYVDSGAYAARVKGPGLPAAGVVYVPTSTDPTATHMTIHNKTGTIPAEGTRSARPQSDFRVGGVAASGAPLAGTNWAGTPTGNNNPVYADAPLSDFSALQAFNVYTIELFIHGQAEPVVETSRILAGIVSPTINLTRPLHDLSPSHASITPPQPETSSVTVRWVRNPLGVRLDGAFFNHSGPNIASGSSGRGLPDANAVTQTSTSIDIPVSLGTAPAFDTTTIGMHREVGLNGRAARARYGQSTFFTN